MSRRSTTRRCPAANVCGAAAYRRRHGARRPTASATACTMNTSASRTPPTRASTGPNSKRHAARCSRHAARWRSRPTLASRSKSSKATPRSRPITASSSTRRTIKPNATRAAPGDRSKGEHITFGCAVIASGAPPFVPPIPGAREGVQSGGVLTSDTVRWLKDVPKTLAVVGGGAIGVEMAQIFHDFGSEVVLVAAQPRILAEVEPEVAKNLTQILIDDPRLTFHTGAKVSEIKGEPGKMQLVFEDGEGKKTTVACDYVIMATGKRPVLEPLELNNAGIAVDKGVIKADARCRTSVPHIFAVGDVIGGYMLAHTAGQQGRVAAANILGEDMKGGRDKDCGVIFSRPEAAFVGLSVEQAKAKGIDAAEVKVPMAIDAKAMIP